MTGTKKKSNFGKNGTVPPSKGFLSYFLILLVGSLFILSVLYVLHYMYMVVKNT